MKKIKILSLFIFTLSFFSCEDYLDIDNPNGPVLEEGINSLEDTQRLLNGVYNSLYNHSTLGIIEDGFRGDEGSLLNRVDGSASRIDQLEYYGQRYTPATVGVGQRWGALYSGIFFANQVLHGLDLIKSNIQSEQDLAIWNNQRAQALFFRGTYHFYLHSVFNNGNIIIVDSYETDLNLRDQPVSSSSEVINFFRNDLREAIPNLHMPSDALTGEVTKGAAVMMLANSYLYTGGIGSKDGDLKDNGDIETAVGLYKALKGEGVVPGLVEDNTFGYSLVRDPKLLFTTAGEFNNESIFEIPYTTQFSLGLDPFDERSPHNRLASFTAHFRFRGQNFLTPATWLYLAYLNESENEMLDDPRNDVRLPSLANPNIIEDVKRKVSLRTSAMIMVNDDWDTEVYGNINALQARGLASRGGLIAAFKKYTNHDLGVSTEQDTPSLDRLKSGKNVIVNRYAEVLLNLAECYIRQGNLEAAIREINEIRDRWALIPLDINDDVDNRTLDADLNDVIVPFNNVTLMERLMRKEKPLELCVEGHATRTIDLRRWEIAQTRFTQLNSILYRGISYNLTALELEEVNRRGNTVTNANGPVGDIEIVQDPSLNNTFSEFNSARANYGINNGYLPLPTEEVINNNKLN